MKLLFTAIVASAFTWMFSKQNNPKIHVNDTLQEVYERLGGERPAHFDSTYTAEEVQQGYEMVHNGYTKGPDGKESKVISKFYTCISCHNVVEEYPKPHRISPKAKLKYAAENDIKMLQGSTFKGMVNKTSWYNDDYGKKYGDLVKNARNSLAESVQLCAKECSQGRELEDWELRGVMAYLQSLQYYVKDIYLGAKDWDKLTNDQIANQDKLMFLQSRIPLKNHATFGKLPKDKEKGYEGITGDPENGSLVYKYACQSCHLEGGESDVVLDNSKVTFKWLKKNITKDKASSFYEIIRNGTYPEKGHKAYMPNYTEEKLSNQQVEDLRAFIEQQAK